MAVSIQTTTAIFTRERGCDSLACCAIAWAKLVLLSPLPVLPSRLLGRDRHCLLLLILGLVQAGKFHRIEQFLYLYFCKEFLLSNDLQNTSSRLVGFASHLGCFFITQ